MRKYPVSAFTEITGFGLLVNLAEILSNPSIAIRLESKSIPIVHEAFEYAGNGFIPGGAFKNKSFRSSLIAPAPHIKSVLIDILFDPQTSGGLLMGAGKDLAGDLLEELKTAGVTGSAIIGEVVSEPAGKIVIE